MYGLESAVAVHLHLRGNFVMRRLVFLFFPSGLFLSGKLSNPVIGDRRQPFRESSRAIGVRRALSAALKMLSNWIIPPEWAN
jgi:hypothetical protein